MAWRYARYVRASSNSAVRWVFSRWRRRRRWQQVQSREQSEQELHTGEGGTAACQLEETRTALVPSLTDSCPCCAGAGLRGRPSAGKQDSGRLPSAQWPFTEKQNRKSPGVEYPQRGRSRVPARYDPIGRTGEGQSSKVRRGPSLALAFPLTFCSGELFVLARRWFRVHIVLIAARYRGSYR
jgi:hypothetical protein